MNQAVGTLYLALQYDGRQHLYKTQAHEKLECLWKRSPAVRSFVLITCYADEVLISEADSTEFQVGSPKVLAMVSVGSTKSKLDEFRAGVGGVVVCPNASVNRWSYSNTVEIKIRQWKSRW